MDESKLIMFPNVGNGSGSGSSVDPNLMLAMNNGGGFGGNGMWNNPFMYLIWLAIMRQWGFNGNDLNTNATTQGVELMNKLNSIQTQISDNNNTNLMMEAINGNHDALHQISAAIGLNESVLQNAINNVGTTIQNSTQTISSQMANCCCENKMQTMQMGYETQLRDQSNTGSILGRIDQLANGVQTGFAQIGYNQQVIKNDVIQSNNANTQRMIDILNSHWNSELQQKYADAKLELSQLNQNATLIAALKTSTTTTA